MSVRIGGVYGSRKLPEPYDPIDDDSDGGGGVVLEKRRRVEESSAPASCSCSDQLLVTTFSLTSDPSI